MYVGTHFQTLSPCGTEPVNRVLVLWVCIRLQFHDHVVFTAGTVEHLGEGGREGASTLKLSRLPSQKPFETQHLTMFIVEFGVCVWEEGVGGYSHSLVHHYADWRSYLVIYVIYIIVFSL